MQKNADFLLRSWLKGRRGIILLCLISAVALGAGNTLAQQSEPPAITSARQSTVYLMQTYTQAGSQVISCVGSGTIISPSGLILTAAHLAEPNGPCRGQRIVVALSVRPSEPPVPTYLAEVVQADLDLDLAVIQIVGGLDGSSVDTRSLNLPYVTVGDPSKVSIGTSLTYIGYPDTGESNVTAIDGAVTGISAEKAGGRMAWFRTGTSLGGAMSGGGAYDANGGLLGMLDSAPATDGLTPGPDCLSIQDSNRDHTINERDACAPVGGNVTEIRPINFALPLMEAATNGFRLSRAPGLAEVQITGQPTVKRLFFAEGISDQGLPTRIVSALPRGAKSVYLFFDYENMRPGTPYELRVTSGGATISDLSLGPLAWGGQRKGLWFIGNENFPLADGDYDFTLLLSGQAAAVAKLTVGSAASGPSFSDLAFSISNASSSAQALNALFPVQQTTQIVASFGYGNMTKGQDWTEVWYLDGSEIFRATSLWDKETNGQLSVSATNLAGLPLGTYRLELLIGQRLAATGDVVLAGNRGPQGQSAAFSNIRLSSDISRDGLPAGQIGSVMPLGINSLYAFMDWDSIPGGLTWTYRWFLNGRLIASSTQAWDNGGVGQNLWVSLTSAQPLPEGTYAVEVLIQNVPMFSATASIGSGASASAAQQGSSDVVNISGTVTDALTGNGIAGALIIVLNVALESPQFQWDESQIYSQAISDLQGHFTLSKGLPRANYYTVYVFADGYTTIIEDNFTILRSQTSPAIISIRMNRP